MLRKVDASQYRNRSYKILEEFGLSSSCRAVPFFLYIVYGRVVLDKLIVAQMVEFSVSYVIPRVVVVFSSRMNPSAGVHGFFKNRFLGAFAKLRKATVSFVMSVRLCIRLSA